MKGTKAKVIGQQRVVPDYEKKRWETLKKNAEFMKSKGHGTLANKILQERAETWSKYAEDEDEYSRENDDYARESEGETSAKVSKQKKSGSMSTFVKQLTPKQQSEQKQQQHLQTQQQLQKQHQPQLEKQQQELVHKKQQEQPDQKQKLLEKLQKQQQLQKLQHPQLQKQQPQLQNQQPQVQKQQHQPLQQSNQQTFPKKQQDMRFCSPGSLSAYRNLRKKQVQNIEHPSNDEVEYGGQPMSINASGMVLEREAENEVQPMIETDNVAHEREAETMIEGSSEDQEASRANKKTDIHARTLEERTPIILNCYGQPIGPTPKDVKDLSRFLGTIARTTEFAPLNYVDWPSVPTHDQIWEYVLEKFMIPPEGRSWVLETVNLSWRGYKSKLKKMYLEAVEKGSNLDELYELVPEDELKDLISYWNTSPAKEQSKKNKRNREKLG
ncbi:Ankyrin repeat domain-containing protein 17 [Bienertia sinuspersici]